MTKTAGDYVLGTGDDELERLGLQHRVWRPHMLAAWQRAGITTGSRVLDVGAGPGYATTDLAEITGPSGRVVGIERSQHYYEHAARTAAARGMSHVELIHNDLMEGEWPVSGFDAAWCRWVACFVSSPAVLVQNMANALRPGGAAIFHEYVDWGTFRLMPRSVAHEDFVDVVLSTWRKSGGEPDIAQQLPRLLADAGMTVTHMKPLVWAITARDFMWQWPMSFIDVNLERQLALGTVDADWVARVRKGIADAAADPHAIMITPMVLEIVATKNA